MTGKITRLNLAILSFYDKLDNLVEFSNFEVLLVDLSFSCGFRNHVKC